ncbi:MAG TPA: CU044_2847 family protein [Trebonia sp.]|jgi:hypothetical protein
MTNLTRFEIEGGGTVLVESADDEGIARAGRTEAIHNATETYQAALSGVRAAAAATLREFTSLPHQPDEVSIEFGVSLGASAGGVIARAGVEGHLQVTLLWKKPQDPAQPATPGPGAEPTT